MIIFYMSLLIWPIISIAADYNFYYDESDFKTSYNVQTEIVDEYIYPLNNRTASTSAIDGYGETVMVNLARILPAGSASIKRDEDGKLFYLNKSESIKNVLFTLGLDPNEFEGKLELHYGPNRDEQFSQVIDAHKREGECETA